MNEDIRRLKNTFVNSDVYVNGQYLGTIKDIALEPGIRKKENQWVVIRPVIHLSLEPKDEEHPHQTDDR